MTGSLDRVLEEALASLIDAVAGSATQCVPKLLGAGEANAVLPRIVVECQRQPSPDFQRVADGMYGLYPVSTTVSCIVEATSSTSSDQMEDLVTEADSVLIYNGSLAGNLTSGTLKVYGVVPRGIRQERSGKKLIRHRDLTIWARLQPVTSEAILTESGEVILTEDGERLMTE